MSHSSINKSCANPIILTVGSRKPQPFDQTILFIYPDGTGSDGGVAFSRLPPSCRYRAEGRRRIQLHQQTDHFPSRYTPLPIISSGNPVLCGGITTITHIFPQTHATYVRTHSCLPPCLVCLLLVSRLTSSCHVD